MQPEGSRDDNSSLWPEMLQAPVQQRLRIVEVLENLSQHHGVELTGYRPIADEVPLH